MNISIKLYYLNNLNTSHVKVKHTGIIEIEGGIEFKYISC